MRISHLSHITQIRRHFDAGRLCAQNHQQAFIGLPFDGIGVKQVFVVIGFELAHLRH